MKISGLSFGIFASLAGDKNYLSHMGHFGVFLQQQMKALQQLLLIIWGQVLHCCSSFSGGIVRCLMASFSLTRMQVAPSPPRDYKQHNFSNLFNDWWRELHHALFPLYLKHCVVAKFSENCLNFPVFSVPLFSTCLCYLLCIWIVDGHLRAYNNIIQSACSTNSCHLCLMNVKGQKL